MKKTAFVMSFILTIACFATGFAAYTFDYEYMDEAMNVSALYSRTASHYHWLSHSGDECYSVFYKSAPVTYGDLTVAEAISVSGTAFLAFEGTAVYDYDGIFSKSSFIKTHEKIFGQELAYIEGQTYPFAGGDTESFTFSGDKLVYAYSKPWESAPDTEENTPVDVRAISYVERYVMNGNKLYVFDKYALVRVSEAKDGKVPVYSSSDSTLPIGYLDYDEAADKCGFEDAMRSYHLSLPSVGEDPICPGNYFSEKADISGFAEYEELLTEYVHTFENDGEGNWYWVSSSPAELMPEIPDTADNSYWIYTAVILSAAAAAVIIRNRRKA